MGGGEGEEVEGGVEEEEGEGRGVSERKEGGQRDEAVREAPPVPTPTPDPVLPAEATSIWLVDR